VKIVETIDHNIHPRYILISFVSSSIAGQCYTHKSKVHCYGWKKIDDDKD
jgi:hypothetical protein